MRWVDSYPEAIVRRDEAARPVLERIERDRATAPVRVAKMLRYLREHLFDPELNVTRVKRECGIRDNSVSTEFHSAVGQPPRAYIEARRLEVAEVMLRESRLRVWQIAELVGYTRAQAFCRAFEQCYATRPGRLARTVGSAVDKLGVMELS